MKWLWFVPVIMLAGPAKKDAPEVQVTPGVKTVTVTERDVIELKAKFNFSIRISLPKEEQIVDYASGDMAFWQVSFKSNMAWVKPSKPMAATNLDLIAASGNVYSFMLREGSDNPDIVVFVDARGDALLSGMQGKPRFVEASQVQDFQEQMKLVRGEMDRLKKVSAEEIAQAIQRKDVEVAKVKAAVPASMKFYEYRSAPVFNIEAIWSDGKFTYIRANPEEAFVVHAEADGKPDEVQFTLSDGLYTIPRVLDRFYLKIGKKELHVSRKKS